MEKKIDRRGARPGERRGGRGKGSLNKKTVSALNMARDMGVDPLEYLLAIIGSGGVLKAPVIDQATGRHAVDADGKLQFRWQAVSLDERVSACRSVLGYLYPKLQSTQITGQNGAPVEIATLDVTQILADPKMAEAAQRMALQIAQQMDPNAPQREPGVSDDARLAPIRRSRHG